MKITLEVPEEYPWILLCAVILCIEQIVIGFTVGLGARRKYFTVGKNSFMSQFKWEHKAAFGANSRPAAGGFPDNGNGLYADKLPYRAWYEMNNAFRTHMNFVEHMPLLLVFMLTCGLYCPTETLLLSLLNVVMRIVYVVLYVNFGPNSRVVGALAGMFPLYGLGIYTLYNVVTGKV